MQQIVLKNPKKSNLTLEIPGSKSITNRALILALLSSQKCILYNVLDCDDVTYMLKAFENLGVDFDYKKKEKTCLIKSTFSGKFLKKNAKLYLGNAGTAVRFLLPLLAIGDGNYEIYACKRMYERPIKPLVDALKSLGANISYLKNQGFLPLKISKGEFKKKDIKLDSSLSSQYISSLLLSFSFFFRTRRIILNENIVSKPYINMTLKMLESFQIKTKHENYQEFYFQENQKSQTKEYVIEPDASSASYFFARAAILGEKITIANLTKNSIQGDIYFVELLEKIGAKVSFNKNSLSVEKGTLKNFDLNLNNIPDAAMTLALVALFAKGVSKISGINTWNYKETNRIQAMYNELTKLGAKVKAGKDFIQITPAKKILDATIDTYDDHRMAMCFALASLKGAKITINNPNCTSKTFPDFFKVWQNL